MKKALSTIGIVLVTLSALVIAIKWLPSGETIAALESSMNAELSEAKAHTEEARLHACDLYATLNLKCVTSRGGAYCTQRDKLDADYVAMFNGGDIVYDCDPANTTPPPAHETEEVFSGCPDDQMPQVKDRGEYSETVCVPNPLFFGDEKSK